jgi:predicted peroxiredoxin
MEDEMTSILVHITHGPEHPTRAALGFHVAKAAIDEGHQVTLFLAGDGVQLMRDGALDHVKGLGTGNLRELYDALAAARVKIYLSGMSSKARGLSEAELEGKNYEFAMPSKLVQLAVEHDKMFTY